MSVDVNQTVEEPLGPESDGPVAPPPDAGKRTRIGLMDAAGQSACATCPMYDRSGLRRLGIDMADWDHVIALAGNPNVGKSTVFNALTGIRQHTGNWPGKTVTRAEGGFEYADSRYKLVDLPGTYSLLATSPDEEIARDFILFGRPDVTVVIVDATRLERNLNLALQVMQITDRVVVALNLVDEAERHGLKIDERRLARDLGVPVVATVARKGEGLDELLKAIDEVASGRAATRPRSIEVEGPGIGRAARQLEEALSASYPDLPNTHWVALRLLDGDTGVAQALREGRLARSDADPPDGDADDAETADLEAILAAARDLRWDIGRDVHETLLEAVYAEAARIADRAVTPPDELPRFDLDRTIDQLVTSRVLGFPMMVVMLAGVFWITIVGANIPSRMLFELLLGKVYPWLHGAAAALGVPLVVSGLLIDGVYLATAWVVSVMLPPMAIFFPLFTLLEDLGYLPRVAFNLDGLFRRAGAHGKQSLSMMMGFGCNAAGVVATRVIDSPRERLIAILTNNFALCNGRWPTQIMIASVFIGGLVSAAWAGVVSALAVVGVALLGVMLSLVVSFALSRTVLRGEVSTFSLELPPYRPPNILQILYTSFIDRTLPVLWRAVVFAMPAGAAIWIISNVHVGGTSLAEHLVGWLDPIGILIGLNGVILVAYIIAIPANEIVIPTVLMLTVLVTGTAGAGEGAGVLFELDNSSDLMAVFTAGGWTLLTAVNLMLFSLIHNPCSTTLYTIYKETGSRRWTAAAAAIPLVMGFGVTFLVTQLWRIAEGVL